MRLFINGKDVKQTTVTQWLSIPHNIAASGSYSFTVGVRSGYVFTLEGMNDSGAVVGSFLANLAVSNYVVTVPGSVLLKLANSGASYLRMYISDSPTVAYYPEFEMHFVSTEPVKVEWEVTLENAQFEDGTTIKHITLAPSGEIILKGIPQGYGLAKVKMVVSKVIK